MSKRIQLPGSAAGETAAFDARSNRFSAVEMDTLAELICWWQHRRATGDAAEPLTSLVGGVDLRARVTTTGLVPALAWLPDALVAGSGASLLVQALGVPANVDAVGEVFTLVGLAHFYRDDLQGYLARYGTIGRLPATTTSTEIRAAVTGSPPAPGLLVVGVDGLTIEWAVEVWRLEV